MPLFRKRFGYGKSTESFFGKPKAKKFNYSSEMNSIVIERAINDEAALTDRTGSSVIEDTLTERFIPADDYAQHYVVRVLFGKTISIPDGIESKYGIREALDEIFAAESAGVNGSARHQNNQRLVEFAEAILEENHVVIRQDYFEHTNAGIDPTHHMLNAWDSICNKLENEVGRHEKDAPGVFEYAQAAGYARDIEHSLKTDPSFLLSNAFSFILENWGALSNYTYSYRFMSSALASSTDWQDSPMERSQFAGICQEVMSGWSAADKARDDAREKAHLDAILTSYDMEDGDTISVPQGWLVANPEDALRSKHAGVIEIKNGERYDAPHILFFCDSPVDSYFTGERRAEALAAATSVWPRLTDVLADEIELEYGPDGGITNMKEFAAAPQICMFRVYDRDKYPLGKPPYGACIIRAGREDNK